MRLLALVWLGLCACQSSDVSRAVGAECNTSDECDVECLGPSSSWPDGFCTVLCDDDTGCPSNARCVEENGGVCAFQCAGDTDCAFLGTAYLCQQEDSHGGGAKVMVCRGDM